MAAQPIPVRARRERLALKLRRLTGYGGSRFNCFEDALIDLLRKRGLSILTDEALDELCRDAIHEDAAAARRREANREAYRKAAGL